MESARPFRTSWVAGLGLLLLVATSSRAEPADDLTLAGVVLDDGGKPVLSYVIRAVPPVGSRDYGGTLPYAITDAQGRFAIEQLVPGRYQLLAGDCETHAKMDPQDARAGQSDVKIRVLRLRTLEGVVQDADGKPLAYQEVRVGRRPLYKGGRAIEKTRGGEALSRTTQTDEAGRFRIARYPSDHPIELRVTIPRERLRDLQPIVMSDLVPGRESLVVVAKRTLAVSGLVRDEEGTPLAGAQIGSVLTDEAGRFEIRPVQRGKPITLRVLGPSASERAWLPTTRKDVHGGTQGLEIVLQRGHVVLGEISGVEPGDLMGYEIFAAGYQRMAKPHVFKGSSTSFRLGPLPRCFPTLQVRRVGRSKAPWTLTGPAHHQTSIQVPTEPVTIRMGVAYTLKGRLQAEAGVGAIHIRYYDAWGRPKTPNQPVRAGTTFEIHGVPKGAGQLVARSADGRFVAVLDNVDPSADPITVTLSAPTSIVGRIDGLPGPIRRGVLTARRGHVKYRARLGPHNTFETALLPPGRYDLEFDIDSPLGGIVPTLRDVEAGAGEVVATWSPDK